MKKHHRNPQNIAKETIVSTEQTQNDQLSQEQPTQDDQSNPAQDEAGTGQQENEVAPVAEEQETKPVQQVVEQPAPVVVNNQQQHLSKQQRQQLKQERRMQAQQQQAAQPEAKIENRAEVPEEQDEQSDIARILEGLSPSDTSNIAQLQNYIREMAPGKIIPIEKGAKNQVGLYRILRNIVNNEVANFDPIMRAALKLFEIHRNGAFHMSQVFRFVESASYSLSKTEHSTFVALVNMFTVAGPVKGRELAVKSIDFDKTLRHNLTNEARERVRAFFKV